MRVLIFALLIAGCNSAMLLREPAMMQCKNQGLKGCDNLADGAIEYATGDKNKGMALIQKGAVQNAPEKVEPFLQILSGIVGAEIPMAAIAEKELASKPMPDSGLAKISNAEPARRKGNVSLHSSPFPCTFAGQATNCTSILLGRITVTDVVFSEGCFAGVVANYNLDDANPTDEVIELLDSSWLVKETIHASRLSVPTGNMLIASSSNKNCFVFWEGFEDDDSLRPNIP